MLPNQLCLLPALDFLSSKSKLISAHYSHCLMLLILLLLLNLTLFHERPLPLCLCSSFFISVFCHLHPRSIEVFKSNELSIIPLYMLNKKWLKMHIKFSIFFSLSSSKTLPISLTHHNQTQKHLICLVQRC
jgi:branched-subunit amino acid permease